MRTATAPPPTWPPPLTYPAAPVLVRMRPARLGQSYGFGTTSQAVSTTGALVSTAGTVATYAPLLIGLAPIPVVGWVAAAVGALLAIAGGFGLFGNGGVYAPKRAAAGREAQVELSSLANVLQSAANQYAQTGNAAVALTALQTHFGARTPVRSWLKLPNALAATVTGQPGSGNYGDRSQVEWTMLDPAGFTRLLAAFQADPSLIPSTVMGSGDVAYLPQAQAEAVAAQAASQGQQFLLFLVQHAPGAAAPAGPNPAAVAEWVTMAYQRLLGRAPSSMDLATAVTALMAQQLTAPQFLTTLTSSAEFQAAHGTAAAVTPTGTILVGGSPTITGQPLSTYWWQDALSTFPAFLRAAPGAPWYQEPLVLVGIGLLVSVFVLTGGRK